MQAALPQIVIDFGAGATVIVAVIGACALLWKIGMKIHHFIASDIEERVWLRFQPVLDELKPNHGSSMFDKLNARFDTLEKKLENK